MGMMTRDDRRRMMEGEDLGRITRQITKRRDNDDWPMGQLGRDRDSLEEKPWNPAVTKGKKFLDKA